MSATTAPTAEPQGLKRVVAAGFMGTTIEYFDFFIYGTAAALVFPKLFFPALGTAAGTAASFATFGVAFLARPVGGLVFGQMGDRVGRKATLITTMLLMGAATVLIGLLPSGNTIGLAAPILLIVLRFLQGLAVGGEWSSAALFVVEHAPPGKRGLYSLAQTLGTTFGLLLATLTFLVIGLSISEAAFASWGWRIPFLLSAILVAVGMWVRLGVTDTPVFKDAMAQAEHAKAAKAPVRELFANQRKEVFLASGSVLMWLSFFYMGAVYLTNYGTKVLGIPKNTMLTIQFIAIAGCILGQVIGARMSDKVGRRAILLAGNGAAVVWAFVLFPMVDTGKPVIIGIALTVTLFVVGLSNASTTVFLPETFRTAYRSTGTGVSFNIGSVVAGALPPILAAPILAGYGSIGLSIMLAVLAAVAVVSVVLMRETSKESLYDHDHREIEGGTESTDAAPAVTA
ncbi:MFS transporter [Janibacter terrae]|uniref:MFS transporter n=1 Tax=Janibacter terrae TaxID=103817 RepID=UPI0009EEF6DF|nr:MFS transporter [Janibacter terrae]HCE61335.1 MFS transporter [Janibacter terrae]